MWIMQEVGQRMERNYAVPLFNKEGLGGILLDKSPFFKGGGEYLHWYAIL